MNVPEFHTDPINYFFNRFFNFLFFDLFLNFYGRFGIAVEVFLPSSVFIFKALALTFVIG